MFEFVHYETHSVAKRAVGIRLKCLLVNDYVHMEYFIFYNIFYANNEGYVSEILKFAFLSRSWKKILLK